MNSVPSKLENNVDELYRKNQVKSISFLVILSGVLLLAILLSLRAGSYETPIGELIKGIFGLSTDRKINIVVRNNRLPRILTAILAGGGLGLAGCILQAVLADFLGMVVKPMGSYFPGYTLTAALNGLFYGMVLYGARPSWQRSILENDGETVLYYDVALPDGGLLGVSGKGYIVEYGEAPDGDTTRQLFAKTNEYMAKHPSIKG